MAFRAEAKTEPAKAARVRDILESIKPLAAEYYELTGKPLGVTGEIGEAEAARICGLDLAPVRTKGYDATRGEEKVQIKTRVPDPKVKQLGRMSRIDTTKLCQTVMLVILDHRTLDAREIWEAPFDAVVKELNMTPAKSRKRGQLAVSSFKAIASRTWKKVDAERQS